jgi:hypothetical protein
VKTATTYVVMFVSATSTMANQFSAKFFGHSLEMLDSRLLLDDKEVLKGNSISLDEVTKIGDTTVLIGNVFEGGASYEGSPFVISFPVNAKPRIDGYFKLA